MNQKLLPLSLSSALAFSLLGNIWFVQQYNKKTQDHPIATLGDQTYTHPELEKDRREVFKHRQALYQSQKLAVDQWLKKKVLELEAKKKNTTLDQLIQQETQKANITIEDKEIQELTSRLEDISPEDARQYLLQLKQRQWVDNWATELLKKVSYKIYLQEPKGPTIEENLAIATRPSFGNPNAKVKMVVFSDFECPYCKRLALDTLNKVRTRFDRDSIFLVYRDLPISHHKYAFNAAIAAKCAAGQSMFWPYHDLLFQNQHLLDRESLIRYGGQVGLDLKTFNNCLLDKNISTQVEEDMAKANQYNLNATPTLIINGEVIEGAVSFEYLKEKIETVLGQ